MGIFKKIFGGSDTPTQTKQPKGYNTLSVKSVIRHSNDTVQVVLEVPSNLTANYQFTAGQYLNFALMINGEEERRSYSICSGPNEAISVAIKMIPNGKVSTYFNQEVAAGSPLFVSTPQGHFSPESFEGKLVAIAAGSGITPILSIAKTIEQSATGGLHLFYGSKNEANILFKTELDGLTKTATTHFLSQETKAPYQSGRITKQAFIDCIKTDLELLKSDGFFICGPEDMIYDVRDALTMFGVPETKIHFELFTTPTHHAAESHTKTSDFTGTSSVTVTLDDEAFTFELGAQGKSILDAVNAEGADAPYSCRGGVCSTCRAKVIEGQAVMDLNYTLTDKEMAEGYILTCQSHPASEKLTITYDE